MDNSEKAGIKDFPDMILSAQMIIEKFGGQEGIMQALYTNPKVSFYKRVFLSHQWFTND